jgi:S1-C subfamily serine protease
VDEPADAQLERRGPDRPRRKLVGIGSLIVRDASGDDAKVPGNLFVPIDTLKTILPDLVAEGPPQGTAATVARRRGRRGAGTAHRVARVGRRTAEEAGVQVGDIILAVNGEAVRTQATSIARSGPAEARGRPSR